MSRHKLQIGGGAGFCNAVRTSLIDDTTSLAAKEVVVKRNTSCFNNEFLAHRLGMIPFRRTESEGMELSVVAKGPRRVYARDLVGIGVEPVYGGVMVACLGNAEQQIDLTVRFDEQRGSKHARYMSVSAVGMRPTADGRHELSFETVDPKRDARDLCRAALDRLERRVDGALLALAQQPAAPLRSCC